MKPEQKEEFKSNLAKLYAYQAKKLKLKTVPKVTLMADQKNADKMLGKTGYYDPTKKTIVLFVNDRHPKDILRSFAHEVIHHWQHENKQLDKATTENQESHDPQYAQHDPWLRQMEKQAYLLGNMMFRDWEDGKKAEDRSKGKKMAEQHGKGNIKHDSHTPIMKKHYDKSHPYRKYVEGPPEPSPDSIEEKTMVIGKDYPPRHSGPEYKDFFKKKALNEGAESMLGLDWHAPECLGPCIIFKTHGVFHYAFSNRKDGKIYFDDGSFVGGDYYDTHGPVIDAIGAKFGIAIRRHSQEDSCHCRVWAIGGKVYIGSWQDLKQMRFYGAKGITDMIKKLCADELGITNTSKIFVNPYNDETNLDTLTDGPIYSFEGFSLLLKSGELKDTDTDKQEKMKQLHLLNPAEKAKELKKLGIKTKIQDMPDWQKKAALGIDEKYE